MRPADIRQKARDLIASVGMRDISAGLALAKGDVAQAAEHLDVKIAALTEARALIEPLVAAARAEAAAKKAQGSFDFTHGGTDDH